MTLTTLGTLCRIVSGTTPATNSESNWGGNIAWITPTDLGALEGDVISNTARCITDAAQTECRLEMLPVGTVVMSSRAPIGHLAITAMPATLNQGCKGFVCNSSIDSKLLLHVLRANMAAIQEMGRGAVFAEVSKSALQNFPIRVPGDATRHRLLAKKIDCQLNEAKTASHGVQKQRDTASKLPSSFFRQEFQCGTPIQAATASVQATSAAGWSWHSLQSLARLESGHTPSRRHPEWWGGSVPWLALPDIRKLHGKIAQQTTENTNAAGIANSSARMLPVGTVCFSRTASVGFVCILGRPMATSQDFCNWVCEPQKLDAEFLMYAFMASQESLRELGSGAVHKTIYMPTLESFDVCAPALPEQKHIARRLRERLAAAEALQSRLKERLAEIERLPQRILAAAFGTS